MKLKTITTRAILWINQMEFLANPIIIVLML